ncbi:MAG: hypothetical protein ACTS40_00775 [Candidatus Hodgkinia cicadicola]
MFTLLGLNEFNYHWPNLTICYNLTHFPPKVSPFLLNQMFIIRRAS